MLGRASPRCHAAAGRARQGQFGHRRTFRRTQGGTCAPGFGACGSPAAIRRRGCSFPLPRGPQDSRAGPHCRQAQLFSQGTRGPPARRQPHQRRRRNAGTWGMLGALWGRWAAGHAGSTRCAVHAGRGAAAVRRWLRAGGAAGEGPAEVRPDRRGSLREPVGERGRPQRVLPSPAAASPGGRRPCRGPPQEATSLNALLLQLKQNKKLQLLFTTVRRQCRVRKGLAGPPRQRPEKVPGLGEGRAG